MGVSKRLYMGVSTHTYDDVLTHLHTCVLQRRPLIVAERQHIAHGKPENGLMAVAASCAPKKILGPMWPFFAR